MDKGYYDYDYSEPKKRRPRRGTDNALMSDEEVAAILATAVMPGTGAPVHEKLTPEELQAEVMEEERRKRL